MGKASRLWTDKSCETPANDAYETNRFLGIVSRIEKEIVSWEFNIVEPISTFGEEGEGLQTTEVHPSFVVNTVELDETLTFSPADVKDFPIDD